MPRRRKLLMPGSGIDWDGFTKLSFPAGRVGLHASGDQQAGDVLVLFNPNEEYALLTNPRNTGQDLRIAPSDESFNLPGSTVFTGIGSQLLNGITAIPRSSVDPSSFDILEIMGFDFTGAINRTDVLRYRSPSWGRGSPAPTVLTAASLGIPAIAVNRTAIRLSSTGTILVPTHYSSGGDERCRMLRSTDGGATWTLSPEAAVSGRDLNEPAIVELGNRVLMVMREEHATVAQPHRYCWYSNDGQTLDAAPVPLAGGTTPQTRIGGSPPLLVKVGHQVLLVYYPGGGADTFWRAYMSNDGENWASLGNIDASLTGLLTAKRYLTGVERHDDLGSVLLFASEPDAIGPVQAAVLWTSQQSYIRVGPGVSTRYLSISQPRAAEPSQLIYFDIYLSVEPGYAGAANNYFYLSDGSLQLARWRLQNSINIFYGTNGSEANNTSRELRASKETWLRIVYNPVTNLISYYTNGGAGSRFSVENVTPMSATWPANHFPDRLICDIQGTPDTYNIRKFEVYRVG